MAVLGKGKRCQNTQESLKRSQLHLPELKEKNEKGFRHWHSIAIHFLILDKEEAGGTEKLVLFLSYLGHLT